MTTKLLQATVASIIAGLMLVATGSFAPARARVTDTGELDITRAQAAHPTCSRAANALISGSKRDYYMRSTAFMRIQRSRLLAANVSTVSTMPNGADVVSTDVVRCVGRAVRRGSPRPTTVYYAITLAPDMIAVLLSGNIDNGTPPPPTYSVTYQTGGVPGW